MKTISKPQSKISQQKIKFASNQAYIQKVANLNDLNYYSRVFETGMSFLDCIYPPNSVFEEFNLRISKSPLFWIWWKSEWKIYENKMIAHYSKSDIPITANNWNQRTFILTIDPLTDQSFHHNFLRNLKENIQQDGVQK